MRATPMRRLLTIALWPLTVWPSLLNLEKHPADDYAERTFPLVATAVGFWVCIGLLLITPTGNGAIVLTENESVSTHLRPSWVESVSGVMWFFIPALYLIGLWLDGARDEAFPAR